MSAGPFSFGRYPDDDSLVRFSFEAPFRLTNTYIPVRGSSIAATLDLLTPGEVHDCLRFVDVMERGQHMSRAEADEWRRRMGAWNRLGVRGEVPERFRLRSP